MARRTRAPARGPRKLKRNTATRRKAGSGSTDAVHLGRLSFTPELLAFARHRYECTDTPYTEIARALRIHRTTINTIAKREGWVRYAPRPRGLPAAARTAKPEADRTPVRDRTDGEGPLPPLSDTVARLHRAVLDELGVLETMRAQMRGEPQSTGEAERTTRTIARLTETLQKIQRLQPVIPASGPTNEDMPANADEIRYALANRIDEFVRSRTHAGDAEGSANPAASDVA